MKTKQANMTGAIENKFGINLPVFFNEMEKLIYSVSNISFYIVNIIKYMYICTINRYNSMVSCAI